MASGVWRGASNDDEVIRIWNRLFDDHGEDKGRVASSIIDPNLLRRIMQIKMAMIHQAGVVSVMKFRAPYRASHGIETIKMYDKVTNKRVV